MHMHLMHLHFLRAHDIIGTMAREESDRSLVTAWRQLLARHAATWCALERELGERHGLGASEFEVLDRLVEDLGFETCRVQDLAGSVPPPPSAPSPVTRTPGRDGPGTPFLL